MIDIESRLLSASVVSESWRSLLLAAYDEIVWLRKEAKMWRLRATKASVAGAGAAEPAEGGEVRQTGP